MKVYFGVKARLKDGCVETIRFGENTTIKDVWEILKEEEVDSIESVGLFESSSIKKAPKDLNDHIDDFVIKPEKKKIGRGFVVNFE